MKTAFQSLLTWGMVALILCAVTPCPADETGEKLRLALVPGTGDRTPSSALVECVQTELARRGGFIVLEREQVRGILAEQQLTAAGLTAPATALTLGRILNADLLLCFETVPKSDPPACQVRVTDGRRGMVLAAASDNSQSLAVDISPVLAAVAAAAAKQRMPETDRRYIGLLGCRSEDPGTRLTTTANALAFCLPAELAATPNVMFLERDYLEALRSEEALTGVAATLASTTTLIDIGLSLVPGEDMVRISIQFQPLREPVQTVVVTVPAKDFAAMRRETAAAVLKQWGLPPPAVSPMAANLEADRFARRAEVLYSHREVDEAIRAMEAAYALAPSDEYMKKVVALCLTRTYPRFADTTEGHRLYVSLLRRWLRGQQLAHDYLAQYVQRWKNGEAVTPGPMFQIKDLAVPTAFDEHGSYLKPGAFPEAKPWRGEIAAERQASEILILDFYEACLTRNDKYRLLYWGRWYDELQEYLRDGPFDGQEPDADAVAAWSRRVNEVITRLERAPAEGQRFPHWARYHYLAVSQAQESFVAACGGFPNRPPASSAVVLPVLDRMARSTDPFLRIYSYFWRVAYWHRLDLTPLRTAADLCLAELAKYPVMADDESPPGVLRSLLQQAIQNLPPDEIDRYSRPVLEPLLRPAAVQIKDPNYLFIYWVKALRKLGRNQEADELEARVKTAAHASVTTATPQVRAEPPLPCTWREVPTTSGLTASAVVVASALSEGNLFLIWQSLPSAGQYHKTTLSLTRLPVKGGKHELQGEASGPATHSLSADYAFVRLGSSAPLQPPAQLNNVFYVYGLHDWGLVEFRDGKAARWGEEDGLPANDILAATGYRGKLYVGLANGLAVVEPATRKSTVLCSSRSLQGRNALDGGEAYDVYSILADQKRGCLWLAVVSHAARNERSGIWKYVPESGQLTQFWPREVTGATRLWWQDDRIVVRANGFAWFCPDKTGTITWLNGTAFPPAQLQERTAPYGTRLEWPFVLDGNLLVSGSRGAVRGFVPAPELAGAWRDGAILFWYDETTAEKAAKAEGTARGEVLREFEMVPPLVAFHRNGRGWLAVSQTGRVFSFQLQAK